MGDRGHPGPPGPPGEQGLPGAAGKEGAKVKFEALFKLASRRCLIIIPPMISFPIKSFFFFFFFTLSLFNKRI